MGMWDRIPQIVRWIFGILQRCIFPVVSCDRGNGDCQMHLREEKKIWTM